MGTPEQTINKIISREKYQYIDAEINYSLYKNKYFGQLSSGLGVTYTWGQNTKVDTAYTSPTPPNDVAEYEYSRSVGRYLGAYPIVNYNYYFWGERIKLGLHLVARKYFRLEDIQIN